MSDDVGVREYENSSLQVFAGGTLELSYKEAITDARGEENNTLYIEFLPRLGKSPKWDVSLRGQNGDALEYKVFGELERKISEYTPEEIQDWQEAASDYQGRIKEAIKKVHENGKVLPQNLLSKLI